MSEAPKDEKVIDLMEELKKSLELYKEERYREEMERQSEQAEADAASLVGR